ncbi:alpha/beta hydrolase [Kineosporia sp. NBRC 101677]|nr:alpha/beta hydrolase [Kineosporia sp. NBRC 101677]
MPTWADRSPLALACPPSNVLAVDTVISPVDGTRIAYRTFPRDLSPQGGAQPASSVSSSSGSPSGSPSPAAPTVLMSHGTALSQAIWRGFGYVRELTKTHNVITVDLRGHGRSEGPHHESAYGMEAFVADLVAVLDRTETSVTDYVGYSLGGRVGFSLAAAHPSRLNRFVSIAGAPSTAEGAFDRVFFPGCIASLQEGGMTGFLEGWQAWTGQPLDKATVHAFKANDAKALAAYMAGSENDPGVDDETLQGLTLPTLMIVGSLDEERLRSAEHVRKVLPDAELLVVEGAGHGSILREPSTLSRLAGFLR